MGIIRGKIWHPQFSSGVIECGEPIWRKCECGKYILIETGEHIEVETVTLEELMDRNKCKDSE